MDQGSDLRASVFAQVLRALPAGCDKDTITEATNLRRGLGLDSLGMASFLFRCGEALGIDPNDLIELLAEAPIQTLGDVVALGTRVMSQVSRATDPASPGPAPRAP